MASNHTPPSLPNSPLSKRSKKSNEDAPNTALSVPQLTSSTIAMTNSNGTFVDPLASSGVHDQTLPSITSMTTVQPLQVKLLSDKAKAPTRGSAFAAGYDVYSAESTLVPGRGQALVSTQIAIAVPAGTYGRIAPRSGLAVKHSITTGAGVIDFDYRGEVKVLLYNLSDKDFEISQGDRIAQLVLERILTPELVVAEELDSTERGAGGFGSTGGFGLPAAADIVKKIK